ncbi:MAG TPA: PEP-utilizing enzyme [Candidatus Saccharimonadales bacterium]|nr:PEP-utilizing enzyme [Candidatus Saccharimonadales bacterium]
MKDLSPLPKMPAGVKYALTVPQSVLFADLSLQGNKRKYFIEAMGIDYEPGYIAIDNGAMSWNYDNDTDFNRAILRDSSVTDAIEHFVETMEKTGKKLDHISQTIDGTDLIDKLQNYWQVYKEHMTSLFTFWNVEKLLSDTLTSELKQADREDEIKSGLVRFLKPDKPNYFVLERQKLKEIAKEFNITPDSTLESLPRDLVKVLDKHRDEYGFLLAPFNLGEPPSVESVLDRVKESSEQGGLEESNYDKDSFSDLPDGLRQLAKLAQRFTYLKTQRLDMFALADARARPLYEQVAKTLSINLDQLFTMTSEEILLSLKNNSKSIVGLPAIKNRQNAYCLALIDGKIGFYQPSQSKVITEEKVSEVIKGVVASIGIVKGNVRIVIDLKDAKAVEKGEVIVTTMTRPEMGIALDRAAAFVTDEGGLLCHAAIISREMKKPCIIATGNATKVLKTGDYVEVDADNGIVKIL